MRKFWDWLMEWLPMVWGLLFVGLVTSGMVLLLGLAIKAFFQLIGVV